MEDPRSVGRDLALAARLARERDALRAENDALHKRHEHANVILAKLEAERDKLTVRVAELEALLFRIEQTAGLPSDYDDPVRVKARQALAGKQQEGT